MAVTAASSGTLTPGTVTSRTVTDGVTNSTTTVTSATAAFVAGDVGRLVTGSADLVAGAYIASVTNGTTAVLSVAATAGHSGQTLTLSNEYVIYDTTAAGTYQFEYDTNALAAGDIAESRPYLMVLTAGTRRPYDVARHAGLAATDRVVHSWIPFSTALTDTGAIRFTWKQTTGTVRAIPWTVWKFA